jgi:hypothetical protein
MSMIPMNENLFNSSQGIIMFSWIKRIYKENGERYERPLLFRQSTSQALADLLEHPRWGQYIRVKTLDEIRIGDTYFDFIDGRSFVRRVRHDQTPSGIRASMTPDLREAIENHAGGYGEFSPKYTSEDLHDLIWTARQSLLSR